MYVYKFILGNIFRFSKDFVIIFYIKFRIS